MNNIMIDLETLGTVPGCAILSIGAVAFDPESGELGPEHYDVIDTKSCTNAGLHIDQDTLSWWGKQPAEAREVLLQAEKGTPIGAALIDFTTYLEQFDLTKVRVWGNGADFDNAIMSTCYRAVGCRTPWNFWNNRCYRTLKSLTPGPKLVREGTYHNALDDAKSQARHAIQLLTPTSEPG